MNYQVYEWDFTPLGIIRVEGDHTFKEVLAIAKRTFKYAAAVMIEPIKH